LLLSRPIIDIVHSIITNTKLDKSKRINILDEIFTELCSKSEFKPALVVAMGLGNKQYIAQALTAQNNNSTVS
jgi:hypothetical protein